MHTYMSNLFTWQAPECQSDDSLAASLDAFAFCVLLSSLLAAAEGRE